MIHIRSESHTRRAGVPRGQRARQRPAKHPRCLGLPLALEHRNAVSPAYRFQRTARATARAGEAARAAASAVEEKETAETEEEVRVGVVTETTEAGWEGEDAAAAIAAAPATLAVAGCRVAVQARNFAADTTAATTTTAVATTAAREQDPALRARLAPFLRVHHALPCKHAYMWVSNCARMSQQHSHTCASHVPPHLIA